MTVRNLDFIFKPRTIALVGACRTPHSVAQVVMRNLMRGGFDGPIMPVSARDKAIEGVLCYKDVASLPVTPDLAVIVSPDQELPQVIDALGQKGCKGAVCVSSGAASTVDKTLLQKIRDASRPHMMRVIGPHGLGMMAPRLGVNASFAHLAARKGDVACLTKSGAVATALLDWAESRSIGFSHMVSMGDMVDVDFGDMLDYLSQDGTVRAILLYLDQVTSARKFMSAARAAARMKPVIVIKSGRSRPRGYQGVETHSARLADPDAVHDAAFRRAGMLRVADLEETFAALETLAHMKTSGGDRLAILTNGSGMSALALDALYDVNGALAELDPATIAAIDKSVAPGWSKWNPVDIKGDATGQHYAKALEALMVDPNVDAVLTLNCPNAVTSPVEAAEGVIAAAAKAPTERKRNLLAAWAGEHSAAAARDKLIQAKIPTYATPEDAVRGFSHMARFRRNQSLLLEAPAEDPSGFTPDRDLARHVIDRARRAGQRWLDEEQACQLLAAYGVPVLQSVFAKTPQEVGRAAMDLNGPFALKIRSADIPHKSDVGGVELDLPTPLSAESAAWAMLEKVRAVRPDAVIDGFTIQEMARRPGAFEVLAGFTNDPTFGPVVLFGQGGVGVEMINDVAVALPPLNMTLSAELMERTRIHKLLKGYRNRPAADLEQLSQVLMRIAQLASEQREIHELDINPLLVDENGVLALDCRVGVGDPAAAAPMAIRGYPNQLEKMLELRDGFEIFLRPVKPEDGPRFAQFFEKLRPEDIRTRFFAPLKALPPSLLARLTQIDYDREMALVATPPEGHPEHGDIWGVVRITADPDNTHAEYAIEVRSDIKGRGLGVSLMKEIIDYGRRRGLHAIDGTILRENEPMIEIVRGLGFSVRRDPDDGSVVQVLLKLKDDAGAAV